MKIGKKPKRTVAAAFLVCLVFSFLFIIVSPTVTSAYTGSVKPMQFYFHHADTPVTVAGLQTKYVMNTTRFFRFLTQQEAYTNSFYKPVGLPKIVVDFYLYPNLAGPVTFNGSWQVFIWANSSAYKPTGFTLDFQEIAVGGTVLWDSGLINPTVTSSVGSYLDVPVYNYNLSTSLSHSFTAGTTLLVNVEVNAGSSAEIRIWYDSPLYPSKVILPAGDYARPASIKTYAVDNSETTVFYFNWSESRRTVIVRANVTDPFGGYDIYRVNMTIIDPAGRPVVSSREMTRISDGQWSIHYLHLFEANWSYPTTATWGNYTVKVSVIDNNGYYHNNDVGSFSPFIEEETQTFTIGVIVYYDPDFLVTDDQNDPLPNAQVYVTWLNGTRDILPRYTAIDGVIRLTHIQAGDYGFTILWKDQVVQQATIHVDSNGPYSIKTQVYQLTVQVFGNNGMPVAGAYVIVYTQSGVGYGLDVSDVTGKALFKLPSGTYRIEAHYASGYWLSVVSTSATELVSVTASTSKNIVLADFPPAIWSTIGFLLLIASIMIAAAAAILIFYRTYKRVPVRRRA